MKWWQRLARWAERTFLAPPEPPPSPPRRPPPAPLPPPPAVEAGSRAEIPYNGPEAPVIDYEPADASRRLTFRTLGEARRYTHRSGVPPLIVQGMVWIVVTARGFSVWIADITP